MHSSAMVSSAMAVSPSDLPAGGLGDLGVGLSLGFQRMMSTSVSWLHQLFDLKTSIKREHWVRTVHSRLVYHVCLCNPLHSSCALKQYSTGITWRSMNSLSFSLDSSQRCPRRCQVLLQWHARHGAQPTCKGWTKDHRWKLWNRFPHILEGFFVVPMAGSCRFIRIPIQLGDFTELLWATDIHRGLKIPSTTFGMSCAFEDRIGELEGGECPIADSRIGKWVCILIRRPPGPMRRRRRLV